MEEKDTYSLETVINTLKGKDVKTQLHILFDTIDSLKEDRRIIEDKYKEVKNYISCNINNYIKAMFLYNNLKTLSMYIEYLDSYLEELKKVVPKCSNCERWGTMECPKVSIVILLKQNHFFKPKQDE